MERAHLWRGEPVREAIGLHGVVWMNGLPGHLC